MLYHSKECKTVERSYSIAAATMNLNYLKTAIDMYTHEIKIGKLDGCVAWSNRGLCKLNLGIANRDKATIQSAMDDFKIALRQCSESTDSLELAQNYMALARHALTTIFG